jgi:hypothetical protein
VRHGILVGVNIAIVTLAERPDLAEALGAVR